MDSIINQLKSLNEEEILKIAKDILPGCQVSLSGSGWECEARLDPDGKHKIIGAIFSYEYGRFMAVRVITESINWGGFRRDAHFFVERKMA